MNMAFAVEQGGYEKYTSSVCAERASNRCLARLAEYTQVRLVGTQRSENF